MGMLAVNTKLYAVSCIRTGVHRAFCIGLVFTVNVVPVLTCGLDCVHSDRQRKSVCACVWSICMAIMQVCAARCIPADDTAAAAG